MSQSVEAMNGQYVVVALYRSQEAYLAEVRHVLQRGAQRLYTPVAHLSAFMHPSADLVHPHWSVRLFVRSDVRFDVKTGCTTVVSNPERQAGQDHARFQALLALRDSDLPCVHPDLPAQLVASLVAARIVTEPVLLHAFKTTESYLREFGTVFAQDSDDA